MKASKKEPRDWSSKNLDEIREFVHKHKVMVPDGATNKLLYALGTGKLRFFNKDDTEDLSPMIARDVDLVK